MRFEIGICDLVIEACIGVLAFEREITQQIQIDGGFVYDYDGAYLDYSQIRDFLIHAFEQKFGLLEEALLYFQEHIPKQFGIDCFWIRLTKLDIFDDCKVSVSLHYNKEKS